MNTYFRDYSFKNLPPSGEIKQSELPEDGQIPKKMQNKAA